jgi:hypothetical protein
MSPLIASHHLHQRKSLPQAEALRLYKNSIELGEESVALSFRKGI